MKKIFWLILILVVIAGLAALAVVRQRQSRQASNQQQLNQAINQTPMKISSPQFLNNENIPQKYTCDGAGINPPLNFSGVPKEAKSLALIIDDPDVPAGTWTHWLLWNVDPATQAIAEGSSPGQAVQGKTSAGMNQYGGPCPPSGTHHYYFKLYALNTRLDLPSYKQQADLESAMQGHILAQAQLVGLYSRGK